MGNLRECLSLEDVVERSNFGEFPALCSYRGMLASPTPRNTDQGAENRYFNPITSRFMDENEVLVVLWNESVFAGKTPCLLGL